MLTRLGLTLSAVLVAIGALVAPASAEPPPPPAPIVPPPLQPENLGDLKVDVTDYYRSGAYLTDLQAATAPAIGWIAEESPRVPRPAVVFDIDETSLSNWDVLKAHDFGSLRPGELLDTPSTVIPPTQDVFRAAQANGAAVFFITGRNESLRAATEENLAAVGYAGYQRLIMQPVGAHYASAADYKAPQRALIEQDGYRIIANLGDQPSDLAGGFAERTYLLPNPFYRIP